MFSIQPNKELALKTLDEFTAANIICIPLSLTYASYDDPNSFKNPAVNGKGWQTKTYSKDLVAKTLEQGGNWGVIGGNGWLGVDIDVKDGKQGLRGLKVLNDDLREYNTELTPETCFGTRSPSNGIHIYVKLPKEFKGKIQWHNDRYPGIDFQHTNRFLVGPGSMAIGPQGKLAHYNIAGKVAIKDTVELPVEFIEKYLAEGRPVLEEDSEVEEEQKDALDNIPAKVISPRQLGVMLKLMDPCAFSQGKKVALKNGGEVSWQDLVQSARRLCPTGKAVFMKWCQQDPLYAQDKSAGVWWDNVKEKGKITGNTFYAAFHSMKPEDQDVDGVDALLQKITDHIYASWTDIIAVYFARDIKSIAKPTYYLHDGQRFEGDEWLSAIRTFIRVTLEQGEPSSYLVNEVKKALDGRLTPEQKVITQQVDRSKEFLPFKCCTKGFSLTNPGEIVDIPEDALVIYGIDLTPDQVTDDEEKLKETYFYKFWKETLSFLTEETIEALQILLATALVGNPHKKILFLIGDSDTGKSTLGNFLRAAVSYPLSMKLKSTFVLMSKNSYARSHDAGLLGIGTSRFIISNECYKAGYILDAEFLKDLASDEYMPLREIREKATEDIPFGLPVLTANKDPQSGEVDDGLRTRVWKIIFENVIDPNNQILDLREIALRPEEINAVWQLCLLPGLRLWYERGKKLEKSEQIKEWSDDYFETQDTFKVAFEACLVKSEGQTVTLVDLANMINASQFYHGDTLSPRMVKTQCAKSIGLDKEKDFSTYRGAGFLKGYRLRTRADDDFIEPDAKDEDEDEDLSMFE